MPTILETYDAPNLTVPTNPIGLALEPLLNQIFTDISREDSREVLQHCYVVPTQGAAIDDEFGTFLLDTAPAYVDNAVSLDTANTYRKFQANLTQYLSKTQWAHTLLVVGGVGAGKTFFLRRYFNIFDDADHGRRDTVPFYLDLRKPELDPTKVAEMIWSRLRKVVDELEGKPVPGHEQDQLVYDFTTEEALGVIFRKQVRELEKMGKSLIESNRAEFDRLKFAQLISLKGDDRLFVTGVINMLRDHYHRRVCVILDNVDQCEPAYQKSFYLYAKTLEAELRGLVIISLREEWYWNFGVRPDGPMSAYHDIVFHVPAPSIIDVLQKRLEYAASVVGNIIRADFSIGNIVVQASSLGVYLDVLQRAFVENHEVAKLLEGLGNGNIRQGLDVFLTFVRSGHTKVEEYLSAIVQREDYKLKFYQVFRSVSLGKRSYYSGSASVVPNIVAPVLTKAGVHSYFLRIYLMQWLANQRKSKTALGPGFVAIQQMHLLATGLGYDRLEAELMLLQMVEVGLVEANVRMLDAQASWTHVRLTVKGYGIMYHAAKSFAFWEALMLDTPITDELVFQKIVGLYPEGHKPTLAHRSNAVRSFVNFLATAEGKEQAVVQSTGSQNCPAYMPSVLNWLEPEFGRLEADAKSGMVVRGGDDMA